MTYLNFFFFFSFGNIFEVWISWPSQLDYFMLMCQNSKPAVGNLKNGGSFALRMTGVDKKSLKKIKAIRLVLSKVALGFEAPQLSPI